MATNTSTLKDISHHMQLNLCKTRPLYRQGRKLTAVKVYTVASESQHLFIYGVPKISLRNELKSVCTKYGLINTIHVVGDVPTEAFTECYHVCYQRIQSARIAKRFLDNHTFFGGVLHVCYAPEYENILELKYKLEQRHYDVLRRLYGENISRPTFKDVTQSLSHLKEVSRKRKKQVVDVTDDDPLICCKGAPKKVNTEATTEIKQTETINPEKVVSFKETDTKRLKIAISTRKVYGPQLPTHFILNQNDDQSDITTETRILDSNTLIPTQVILSKEYIYQKHSKDSVNKIVFRKN